MATSTNATFVIVNPPYDKWYWVFCEGTLVALTTFSIYLCFCVLKHATTKEPGGRRSEQSQKQKVWLKWLPVFTAIITFLRLCSDHAVAFLGWQSDSACLITISVSTVAFTIAIYAVYIFLWIRQSIFYANPLMSKIINRKVIYVSWFSLVFMLVSGLTIGILYNIPQVTGWHYAATDEGCKEVSEDSPEIIPGVMAGSTVLFQISLLALFAYPLMSSRTEKYRNNVSASPGGDTALQESTLSRSEEKAKSEDNAENDSVFLDTVPQANSVVNPNAVDSYNPRKSSASTLDGRGAIRSETDYESGGDLSRATNLPWGGSPTFKRDTSTLPPERRLPRRKTIIARFKDLRQSSIFYQRSKSNSVSSENMGSPVTSDSESRERRRSRRGLMSSTLRRYKSSKKNEQGRRLMAMMKKYTLLMFACVITDVGVGVVQIFLVVPELIYLTLFDISLMVNLICIILTFGEWQTILMPFFSAKKVNNNSNRGTTSTRRLWRKATPLSKRERRVEELKREAKRGRRPKASSRRSSGSVSGYDSADSVSRHGHIYKPARDENTLL